MASTLLALTEQTVYENRYVAYIDVLGWRAKTEQEQITKEIIGCMNLLSSEHIRNKEYHEDPHGNDSLQFCFCSDSVFISSVHQSQIVSVGNLVRKFLSLGLLCRGAITKGRCYHQDNIVFGDAVTTAVKIEECKKNEISRMPAVLIDHSAVDLEGFTYSHSSFTTRDQYERLVLNIVPSCVNRKGSLDYDRRKISHHFEVNKKLSDVDHLKKWAYAEALFNMQWQESLNPKKRENLIETTRLN